MALALAVGALLLGQAGDGWARNSGEHRANHAKSSSRTQQQAKATRPSQRTQHAANTAASSRTKQTAQPARHRAVAKPAAPRNVAQRPLIVIDPGHGGRDPGAIGVSGTQEKTVTLATALELRRALQATGRYRIELTRATDSTVSLAGRLAFARKHDADLLIAIHADASRNRQARGASVYVSSRGGTAHLSASPGDTGRIARALSEPGPQPEPGSAWLQYTMIEQLADDVRMVVAPARTGHLYVLGSRTIPSVLLEMGFLSNRQDEALLKQTGHRGVLVRAIKDAVDDYFAAIHGAASRT